MITHTLTSEYQRGPNKLNVVTPESMNPDTKYPVIYTLPVAAGPDEERDHWGWSVAEVLGISPSANHENLADKYEAIFVFPVFDTLPWYGDNAQDCKVRQESYLMKVVIPFIENTHPVLTNPSGRMLMGFSKSGFGAISLLLRHLELFGRAAIFDAPLMLNNPGPWGSDQVYPTPENFAGYAIPTLLKQHAAQLRFSSRMILLGYCGFREHMHRAHALMAKLGIPHEYRDGPKRAHTWSSGWVPEAVSWLMTNANDTPNHAPRVCAEPVQIQPDLPDLLLDIRD